MNGVKKTDLVIVEPADIVDRPRGVITDALTYVGIGSEDHTWMLKILMRPECLGLPSGEGFREDTESIFRKPKFLEEIKNLDGRSSKLLIFASSLAGFGPAYFKGVDKSTSWLAEYSRLGNMNAEAIDWESIAKFNLSGDFYGVFLPEIIQIDPNGTGCKEFDNKYFTYNEWFAERGVNTESCEALEGFKTFLGDDATRMILDCFLNKGSRRVWSDSEVAQVVLEVSQRLFDHSRRSKWAREALDFEGGWDAIRDYLQLLWVEIDRRTPETSQNDLLVRAWWLASLLLYDENLGGKLTPDDDRLKDLLTSAKLHVGKMRAELKKNPDKCDFEHYGWAVAVLKAFATPWQAVNPLLLVFAEMTKQAVSPDLRFWKETGKPDPPKPFVLIPAWIATSFYSRNLKTETDKDPTLSSLRAEFSKFSLSRLRTRKSETKDASKASKLSNESFVESRPWWRLCYVRAIQELGVNPSGKAQKAMLWLSQNDPEEDVKLAAKTAYHAIRSKGGRGAKAKSGGSPRRPLFAAFWWLRQAHLLTLGIQVDQDGANRTRDTEIRRTSEA